MLQLLPFCKSLRVRTVIRALFYAPNKLCGTPATSHLLILGTEGGRAGTSGGGGRSGADVKQWVLVPLQHPPETSEV